MRQVLAEARRPTPLVILSFPPSAKLPVFLPVVLAVLVFLLPLDLPLCLSLCLSLVTSSPPRVPPCDDASRVAGYSGS